MPKVKANGITLNYEQQGTGEPLVLIPYLAADHACYAFQVGEYAKHFTCIARSARRRRKRRPGGPYSMDLCRRCRRIDAGDGVERAHVTGLSLGAATGIWLAAKYPGGQVAVAAQRLDRSDPFLKTVVEGWRTIAEGLGSVTEMMIQGIFPWCFTPELYAAKPDYIDSWRSLCAAGRASRWTRSSGNRAR